MKIRLAGWLVLLVLVVTAASASAQIGVITQFNLNEVDELVRLNHPDVVQVAWSPDGLALAVAAADGVWVYTSFDAPPVHVGAQTRAHSIAFSADGARLLVADTTAVQVWDVVSNALIVTLDAHAPVVYSHNGRWFAAAQGENTVVMWDTATLEPLYTLAGHTDAITALAFSRNDTILASSSLDTTVRLWNTRTGEQFAFQRSRRRPVLALDFNPSGFLNVAGATQGVVRITNIVSGVELRRLADEPGDVAAVTFAPASDLIALASGLDIQFWDGSAGELVALLPGHDARVVSLAFSPDGTLLASAADDATVRIWGIP